MTLWNVFKVYILVWDHLLGSIKVVNEFPATQLEDLAQQVSSGENGHQIQKDSSSGDREYALGV